MNNLKVLGITWDNVSDTFCIKSPMQELVDDKFIATKRNVLKVISSIYDPIGVLSSLTVVFKMFFQLLCINKLHWDESLSSAVQSKWSLMVKLASNVCISVLRYYFGVFNTEEESEVILHGFCDASKKAYAAVIYVTAKSAIGVSA